MKDTQIELAFVKLSCTRCGGERLAKLACPECGARPQPHETQPEVDRRARLVAEVETVRQRGVQRRAFPDDLPDQIENVLHRIKIELGKAAKLETTSEHLAGAFLALDQLVEDTATPLHRPHRNNGRRQHQACQLLRDGMSKFLELLAAPSILEAQKLAQDGQELIDASTREKGRYREISDQIDSKSAMHALGVDHAEISGGSFTNLISNLGQKLNLPGQDVGLQVSIDAIDVASESMDRQRLMQLSDIAATTLNSTTSSAITPKALDDILTASLIISTDFASIQRALLEEDTDLEVVSHALSLCVSLRERGLRVSLAVLISAVTNQPYAHFSSTRVGRLIKKSYGLLPSLELDEGDRDLRDAASHQDFTVSREAVQLRSGERTLTPDEFVDIVLTELETHLGLLRGILTHAVRAGLTMPTPDQLPHHIRQQIIEYICGVSGLTDITIDFHDNCATLSATPIDDYADPVTLIAAIAPLAPSAISRIKCTLPGRTTTADLHLLRQWSGDPVTENDESMLAFLRAMAGFRDQGVCPLPSHQWAAIAASVAEERHDDQFVNRIRRVIAVRREAQRAEVDQQPIDEILSHLRKSTSDAEPRRDRAALNWAYYSPPLGSIMSKNHHPPL